MTDLSSQISLFSSHLDEQLEKLENEYQRWTHYKNDYDALERQLLTLPDTTSKQAMIPIGKLAFMPGKIVHTNEILVLLGDQYYAERSAKQAVNILGRRKEVVMENMRLAEAQLNSFKTKKDTLTEASGTLTPSGQQLNEEGLPIMEIREELPPLQEEKKAIEPKEKAIEPKQQPLEGLPESVLRARSMMKEADEKIKGAIEDSENKALFDLLRELEEEEEEEEKIEDVRHRKNPIQMTVKEAVEYKNNRDSEDDDDDDEEDGRYDTEIADNMFDRFGDDEEYGLDGVVDQEDFTHYEQEVSQVSLDRDDFDYEDEDEKSTPKVITKKKAKPVEEKPIHEKPVNDKPINDKPIKDTPIQEKSIEDKPVIIEPKAKKLSKFKQAQLEKKTEAKIETKADKETEEKPKKFSKFKLLRQEQKQRPTRAIVEETKEQETVPTIVPSPVQTTLPEETAEYTEPKPTQNRQIPNVATQKKKPSRFKSERTAVAIEKPKRTVTWDTTTTVRDHDALSAPSAVSTTDSYSQPMKSEPTKTIRSPADIFRVIRQTQQDGYPSLEEDGDVDVDLNQLIQVARETKEPFYRSADGSDVPMLTPPPPPIILMSEEEQQVVPRKSKLDNKVMKGAVMERDIVPVDFEQVEEEMDLREITSNYQQKRQSMLAATGGFSFDMKPEFEVFDEELPLPKRDKQADDEEEEVAPKKISRFKAARLGMSFNNEESLY
ncbi:hypothetical protein A0J61_09312 [Choanephora cucurbitarum]|uniref:DUF3835 domain-containing protein n=1 Tax=Choanephora cucurbitarum TaxID=101091 RepID=A0A1C7N0K7_9FUNG|nr:hypothetical protein A0J61_09312 [Choanephora cucurbitarum]